MFWAYIIENTLNSKKYIGSSDNIDRRLDEHNRGKTKSTKYAAGYWKLAYSEKFDNRLEATKKEKMLKSYKSGNTLKELLKKRD